jgi:AcrR family transcriptional regulator
VRRTSALRDRTLACFAEQVANNGYSGTSLSDVAAMASVSKGTIVHHFGTKERMLVELELAFMTRREEESQAIQRWYEDPVDQLIATMFALLRVHRDDRILARAFMREFTMLADSQAMKPVRDIRDRYQARLSDMVERGMREGSLGRGDVALITLQIFGMCNHAWTWYRPDGPHTLNTIAESFITVLLHGLASEDLATPARISTLLADVAPRLDAWHATS